MLISSLDVILGFTIKIKIHSHPMQISLFTNYFLFSIGLKVQVLKIICYRHREWLGKHKSIVSPDLDTTDEKYIFSLILKITGSAT